MRYFVWQSLKYLILETAVQLLRSRVWVSTDSFLQNKFQQKLLYKKSSESNDSQVVETSVDNKGFLKTHPDNRAKQITSY